MRTSPTYAGTVTGLVLFRSHAGNYEFVSAMAPSAQWTMFHSSLHNLWFLQSLTLPWAAWEMAWYGTFHSSSACWLAVGLCINCFPLKMQFLQWRHKAPLIYGYKYSEDSFMLLFSKIIIKIGFPIGSITSLVTGSWPGVKCHEWIQSCEVGLISNKKPVPSRVSIPLLYQWAHLSRLVVVVVLSVHG